MMSKDEFERFNVLSKKALKETATEGELLEFKELLLTWNNSVELNLFNYFDNSDSE